jgi:Right handed beta helix region
MSLAVPLTPQGPLHGGAVSLLRDGATTKRRKLVGAMLPVLLLVGCSDGAGQVPPTDLSQPFDSSMRCEVGEKPAFDGTCAPVGPAKPGSGFAAHPDGWGHIAIKPDTLCEGTRMAKLGNHECVPVDDHLRSFPPVDVHAVVSTTDELTAAMVTAPAGGVIALLPGTYSSFEIKKAVRLVGQSPEEVIIQGPGTLEASSKGITVSTVQKVALESLTISGFGMAIKHVGGGHLDIANLYITDSRGGLVLAFDGSRASVRNTIIEGPDPARDVWDAIGVSAFWGATIELDDVDIRRFNWAISARYPGSDIEVRNAVVQFEERWPYAAGIEAWGGNVTMEDSVMSAREGRLVAVGMMTDDMSSEYPVTPGSVHIRRSVLEQRGAIMDVSSAIDIYQGATLELDEVSLRHEAFCGIGLSDGTSTAKVHNSVFSTIDSRGAFHSFVIASQGKAEVSNSAFVGAKQVAFIADGSSSELGIEDSLITGTKNYDGSTSGAITTFNGGRVNLNRSTLSDNEGIAVVGIESGTIAMTDVLVQRTTDIIGFNLGIGVAVQDAQLLTRNCKIASNEGLGLFVGAGSRGLLVESTVEQNPVGLRLAEEIDLQNATVEPGEALPGTTVLYRTKIQDNAVAVEIATNGLLAE